MGVTWLRHWARWIWPVLSVLHSHRHSPENCSKLKGTQALNLFKNLFLQKPNHCAWSQGSVTREFWKLYSIRSRYLTFKHFCVSSDSDEICSVYAQPAMKSIPGMLSIFWMMILKWFRFTQMLSMSENWLLVRWACAKIGFSWVLAKHRNRNSGKNRKKIIETFSNIDQGHIRFCFRQKNSKLYHACVPLKEAKFSQGFVF